MIGAHIAPGDMAVIDKSREAKRGDIVLAYVNEAFTIKRQELISRLRIHVICTYILQRPTQGVCGVW
ncbi:LexA family protein [Pontibacter sp. CAU 1760]